MKPYWRVISKSSPNSLTKELLAFLPSRQKYEIGSDEKRGVNLIKELVEDFVFPASRLMLQLRSTGELSASQSRPVCATPRSTSAALDLFVGPIIRMDLSTACGTWTAQVLRRLEKCRG